jgi:hypothetical protein
MIGFGSGLRQTFDIIYSWQKGSGIGDRTQKRYAGPTEENDTELLSP